VAAADTPAARHILAAAVVAEEESRTPGARLTDFLALTFGSPKKIRSFPKVYPVPFEL
jgi:hypothetical protein